jgi:DNA primase
MIPDSFIQDLLYRVDLIDLIDSYVPLKKTGANFAACCPFHSEKSPSFTVSPSKQFYHCFGCGAHGNAIGFIMAYSGAGFIDALKELAARCGLQLPDDQGHAPQHGPQRQHSPKAWARPRSSTTNNSSARKTQSATSRSAASAARSPAASALATRLREGKAWLPLSKTMASGAAAGGPGHQERARPPLRPFS